MVETGFILFFFFFLLVRVLYSEYYRNRGSINSGLEIGLFSCLFFFFVIFSR